jgi:hypothetical protein
MIKHFAPGPISLAAGDVVQITPFVALLLQEFTIAVQSGNFYSFPDKGLQPP